MATAEHVIESLRRGSPERSLDAARESLAAAIRDGRGHIVVIGASEHEASVFVESALQSIEDYKISHATVRISPADLDGERVLLVVHHADSAAAADLETLRMVVEGKPDSVERVRMILVGLPALERTLATPEARALASRIGSYVHLPEQRIQRARRAIARRRPQLNNWQFVASAVTAIAAIVCVLLTDLPERSADESVLAWLMQASVEVGRTAQSALRGTVVRERLNQPEHARSRAGQALTDAASDTASGMGAVLETATATIASFTGTRSDARRTDGSSRSAISTDGERLGSVPDSIAGGSAAGSARGAVALTPAAPASRIVTSDGSAAAGSPRGKNASSSAGGSAAGDAVRSALTKVAALFSSSAPNPRGTAVRRTRAGFSGVSNARASAALIASHTVFENFLMMRTLRSRDTGSVAHASFLQVGSFTAARSAFSLKSALAEHFDSLAVAHFDPEEGPLFSVRVFDDAPPPATFVAPGRIAAGQLIAMTRN